MVAREFVAWLAVPPDGQWLDVGCGTGALTQAILNAAGTAAVVGVDASSGYVEFSRSAVADSRVTFEVGDAQRLAYEDTTFDAAVSGLVLNFVPHPERMVSEMTRVVRSAGVVAAYVWDYSERMQMMRHFWDAALSLFPEDREKDEAVRFPLCRPEPLHALFVSAGLKDVEMRAIDVPTRFRDFDDFWMPFLGGDAPAPGYARSLSEERLSRLRDEIRRRLPVSSGGRIDLTAGAWAVRGYRS